MKRFAGLPEMDTQVNCVEMFWEDYVMIIAVGFAYLQSDVPI